MIVGAPHKKLVTIILGLQNIYKSVALINRRIRLYGDVAIDRVWSNCKINSRMWSAATAERSLGCMDCGLNLILEI